MSAAKGGVRHDRRGTRGGGLSACTEPCPAYVGGGRVSEGQKGMPKEGSA
jgi:hypothetical protein